MGQIRQSENFLMAKQNISEEHHKFLEMIKKVSDAISNKLGQKIILEMLSDIEKHAENHFQDEETLMLEYSYPDFKEHRLQHAMLLTNLDLHINQYRISDSMTEDLVTFLEQWLTIHTHEADEKFIHHLNSIE